MLTLITGDRHADTVRLEVLQRSRNLVDFPTSHNGYICVGLVSMCLGRDDNDVRAIRTLIDYIQQDLAHGDCPPGQRTMQGWLIAQGAITLKGSWDWQLMNLARRAWLDRMIGQLEEALATGHQVVVGNVGTVYSGPDIQAAYDAFHSWVTASSCGAGRAAGEPVTWFQDGEIHEEHQPEEPTC